MEAKGPHTFFYSCTFIVFLGSLEVLDVESKAAVHNKQKKTLYNNVPDWCISYIIAFIWNEFVPVPLMWYVNGSGNITWKEKAGLESELPTFILFTALGTVRIMH